jgi:hypothetical protein
VGLTVAALAVLPAAPASADVLIGADKGSRVSAYGNVQAWLRRSYDGRRTRLRIILRVNGVVAQAPIRPFDSYAGFDLGPGRAPGSVVAVYGRCRGTFFKELCAMYELDIATGRERRVPGLSSRRASVSEPSTWAGRYAFGRVEPGHGQSAGRRYGLFTGVRQAKRLGSRRPALTDVDANVVAYSADAGTTPSVYRSQIRLRHLRGRADCLIDKRDQRLPPARARDDDTVANPVLAGGYAYWSVSGGKGTSPVVLHRVPIPGADCRLGPVERATVALPPVTSGFAIDGTQLYYVGARGVFQTDLPPFAPA